MVSTGCPKGAQKVSYLGDPREATLTNYKESTPYLRMRSSKGAHLVDPFGHLRSCTFLLRDIMHYLVSFPYVEPNIREEVPNGVSS